MGYGSRTPSSLNLGCLPAAIFGLVVGGLAAFVTMMGECVDEGGRVASCPNERLVLLAIVVVTAALCAVIALATNWMITARARNGKGSGQAVAGGFLLASALALAFYVAFPILS